MAVIVGENTCERHDIEQTEQTFSVKDQILNSLGLAGHKVSVSNI